MNISMIQQWDEKFFLSVLNFKAILHQDIPTSFPEEIGDYLKFFGPESLFTQDFEWRAFVVTENEKTLAQAVLCWKKGSSCGNLGFLDWLNNPNAATLLTETVEKEARKLGLQTLKTPIDMTFFNKYRIRLPGGQTPLWGEPMYPEYYHELFKHVGFNQIGLWQTYRLKKLAGMMDYLLKRRSLKDKHGGTKKEATSGVLSQIRNVSLSHWDRDLKIIYDLFHGAYKDMPEYEGITFPQFKIIYDDFKYVINPLYAYIFEYKDKPVGFSINYADPLPVLLKVKGKKLSQIQKAMLLVKLRLNLTTFVIAHVGKVPGPNGENIKGVQIGASTRISLASIFMKKVVSTFHGENSPARRVFNYNTMEVYAEYVLYGKNL